MSGNMEHLQKESAERTTQRNFRSSPFLLKQWEVVGEQDPNRDFVPADIEVLDMESQLPDPMFDIFEESKAKPGKKVWHSETLQEVQEVYVGPTVGVSEEEVARLVQEAYQQGLKEGQQAAIEQAREEATTRQRKLEQNIQELNTQLNKKVGIAFKDLEQKAVEFALMVSRKILKTTADIKPEAIYEIIRTGLAKLGAATPLRIRLSAADHEFVEVVGLPEDLQREDLSVQYVIDDSIEAGCVIETDFGEIDLQLDHMWAQVAETIFDEGQK